jgi:SAM-dependent methyltransferase
MPILPADEPHQARHVAESFGADAERYDRARPRYPAAVIDRIVAALPGPDVLDVGTGTGIAALQFAAAGCRVLGVEVDPRMAAVARQRGLEVEVSGFETWEPAGRTFDGVVAGQTWHWIDPATGAAQAARVLRPGGRIALFWNVVQPPAGLAGAFAAVYRRVVPDLPYDPAADAVDSYARGLLKLADGLRDTGRFAEPDQWRHDWSHTYTRAQWLDLLPTFGGHHLLAEQQMADLAAGIGAAVDEAGGAFPAAYATLTLTAATRH